MSKVPAQVKMMMTLELIRNLTEMTEFLKVFDALFYIRNKSVTNKIIHNSSIVCDISSRKVHEFNYWYSEISYSRFYLPLCKIVKSKVEWDTLRYKYGSKYITFQYIITF